MHPDSSPVQKDGSCYLSESSEISLKKEINGLIWEYGRNELTLEEAEDRAAEIFNLIQRLPGQK